MKTLEDLITRRWDGLNMIASVFREKISLNVRKDIFESLKKDDAKNWECENEEEHIIYNYYGRAMGPIEYMVINICDTSIHSFLLL